VKMCSLFELEIEKKCSISPSRDGNVVNLVSMDTWQQHPPDGTLFGSFAAIPALPAIGGGDWKSSGVPQGDLQRRECYENWGGR